jgi:uncharacterized protein YjbI with pentapeptide repeats
MPGSSSSKPPAEPYPPDLADEEVIPDLDDGLQDVVVTGLDWANRRSPRAKMVRTELRATRLTGAELGEATLTDLAFTDCRLDLAGLRNATLERVIFRDCRMDECDLYDARLNDVLFERCTLREATFSGVTIARVELRGCDLSGLRGAEHLRGARLPFQDALENAALFATALGIELID